MSVTGEDIVAAHGHIACGIRNPGRPGTRSPRKLPIPSSLCKSLTQTGRGA
jgi:hypothetical protein